MSQPVPTFVATPLPTPTAGPLPTPGPPPGPLPETLLGFWTLLYNAGLDGPLFGVIASFGTDWAIRGIEALRHAALTDTQRRLVAAGMAALLVLVGYTGVLLNGGMVLDGDAIYRLIFFHILPAIGATQGTWIVRQAFGPAVPNVRRVDATK